MNKKITKFLAVLLIICFTLTAFSGCMLSDILTQLFGNSNDMSQSDKADYILTTVYDFINSKYVDELTDEQLDKIIESGADAMLGYYDNYGFLITPEQYHDLMYPSTEALTDDYFGFQFTYEKYMGLLVSSIVTDSNVYGKLAYGDIIYDVKTLDGKPLTYTVDGETKTLNVRASNLTTVAEVLKNYRALKISVLRGGTYENLYEDGEHLTMEIRREKLNNSFNRGFEYVEYYFGAGNNNVSPTTIALRDLSLLNDTDVGYMRLTQFSSTYDSNDSFITDAKTEIYSALEIMKAAGKTRLILDLKGNPGGDVQQVKNIAGYFIFDATKPTKELLVTTMKDRNEVKSYSIKSSYGSYFDTNADKKQIVVLTDGHSASASELLLGAMLDYGTCVQVGETSFGKGIAQYIQPIVKGTFERDGKTISSYYGIYYTAAYYYTPSGNNIHKKGFTPDAENVKTNYADIMERSLEILGK